MNELGVLRIVNEVENIVLYHVHTIKTHEQKKWKIGDIFDTKLFEREPSYNIPKRFRERAFEIVRQKEFIDLPSRMKCLFLSASLETAKAWYYALGGDKQLLKIRLLSGKYVNLDETIYEIENFTDDAMKSDALDYWGGDEIIGGKKIAVLFDGVFKVEEELHINE